MDIKEISPPAGLIPSLRREGCSDIHVFVTSAGNRVIRTVDHTKWGPLVHLSISNADRYPAWEEILEIKDKLGGKGVNGEEREFMMVMPRKEMYVNLHPNCFHIMELPGPIAPWPYL